jgi:uncharacterized protein YggU (UPF0235/DUF167 family)
VIPRSPKSAVAGVRDGRLLIRVTAPPVDDAANEAVLRLLAERLAVPRRRLHVIAGATGRNKIVGIDGASPSDVRQRLGLTPPER